MTRRSGVRAGGGWVVPPGYAIQPPDNETPGWTVVRDRGRSPLGPYPTRRIAEQAARCLARGDEPPPTGEARAHSSWLRVPAPERKVTRTISLPSRLWDEVDAAARAETQGRSAWVRDAIERQLEKSP